MNFSLRQVAVFLLLFSALACQNSGWAQQSELAATQQHSPVLAEDRQAVVLFAEDLNIAVERSAVLDHLEVSEGDIVESGQPLAKLDDQQARLEQELAEQQLALAEEQARDDVDIDYAKMAIEFATANLERARQAQLSQAEVEQSRFELERSQMALQQAMQKKRIHGLECRAAEARKNLALLDVSRHRVNAPAAGTVVELYRRPGEFLQTGQPLMRIVRNDVMRVSAAIGLEQVAAVRRGFPVAFQVEGTDANRAVYSGKVILVSPETFGEVRFVKVLAELKCPQRDLKAQVTGVLQILAPHRAPPE